MDVNAVISFFDTFVNVDSILSKAGYDRESLISSDSLTTSTTSGVISFLLLKLTSPFRLLLDCLMVPLIVRVGKDMGLLVPLQEVDESKVELKISNLKKGAKDRGMERVDEYADPVVKAIRTNLKYRSERRIKQMKKYQEMQKKMDKVFKKKNQQNR